MAWVNKLKMNSTDEFARLIPSPEPNGKPNFTLFMYILICLEESLILDSGSASVVATSYNEHASEVEGGYGEIGETDHVRHL